MGSRSVGERDGRRVEQLEGRIFRVPRGKVGPDAVREHALLEVLEGLARSPDALADARHGAGRQDQPADMIEMCMCDEKSTMKGDQY
jgi:hypothetical protein